MTWCNPPEDALRDLLTRVRTIAVVGASPEPTRPAHWISEYLVQVGYEVVPVRPGGATLHGRVAVPSLLELPSPADLAVVFRAHQYVAGHVDEALRASIPAIWLQDGVFDLEAGERARQAGLSVVMNDCIYRVHRRLLGT